MTMLLLLVLLFILGLIPITKKFLAWQNIQFLLYKTPANITESKVKRFTSNKVDLRRVFDTFDKNKDGFITKEELKESLENIGIFAAEKDVEDMVENVDSNGDCMIDFDEFCKLFDSISSRTEDGEDGHMKEEEEEERDGDLKGAFDVFDENKDGVITVEELGLVLSSMGFTEGKKLEDCKEMISKVDKDGDGMVNFDEFKRMMRAGGRLLVSVS